MVKTANRWISVILLIVFLGIIALAAGRQSTTTATNVLVVNSKTQPVPVSLTASSPIVSTRDAAHGKDFIQFVVPVTIPDMADNNVGVLSALPGERLIVTSINIYLGSPSYSLSFFVLDQDNSNNVVISRRAYPPGYSFTPGGGVTYSGVNLSENMILDPGQSLHFSIGRNGTSGSDTALCTVTGYRVTYP